MLHPKMLIKMVQFATMNVGKNFLFYPRHYK